MTVPRICKLTFERNASPIGIGQARPTLSWRYEQDAHSETDWTQNRVEFTFTRGDKTSTHAVDTSNNVEVPWPETEVPLSSRERVEVMIRAQGGSGWTDWYTEVVEASLLDKSDWSASVIAPDIVPLPILPNDHSTCERPSQR
jgi:alpha-L-rhamnosidase